MPRVCPWIYAPLLIAAASISCWGKAPEITDPEEAKKDPDFLVQGEYLGEGSRSSGESAKFGAQVIARGKGEFSIILYKGGLPGDGWKRGDEKSGPPEFSGKTNGNEVQISGGSGVPYTGKIAGDKLTLSGSDEKYELKRIERKSPTLGAKPPAGAAVLFDGTTADNFERGKLTKGKNLLSDAVSKRQFGDYRLHLEFRTSYMPEARGQARSNSGVYIHDCYEIQILDSFGLEGKNDECGGFFSIRQPDVNACFPPLAWQTYDIDFTAPKFEKGKKTANARITVKHNGVTIHDNVELPRPTSGSRQKEGPAPRPFYLQGHGNKVEFRNIWVEEK